MESLLNTVVMMPERRLVTLVTNNPDILREAKPEMQDLADIMLTDTRSNCTSDPCLAEQTTFTIPIPEINGTVHAIGVICNNACNGLCPAGIRIDQ